jgi:dephospho-CoA kinase
MHLLKLKAKFDKLNKNNRLYNIDCPIIGLTGGIASGKSTVANFMRQDGLCVIDADSLIKEIYQKDETIKFISSLNPEFIQLNQINFQKLRKSFFNDQELKKKIEYFLYQKLPQAFLAHVPMEAQVVIYDVPLLFEKHLDKLIDISVVVYAPRETQLKRLVIRDKIDKKLASSILDQQMSIEDKRLSADFVIDNTQNQDYLLKQYQELKEKIFDF